MRTKNCLRRVSLSWLLAASWLLGVGVAVAQAPPGAPAAHGSRAQPVPRAHSGPVILIGQMTVKAGRVQDFIKLIAQMKSRVMSQDHGNIRYELFRVVPRPGQAAGSSAADRTFYFLEEWRDQAAAAAHGKWAGPIVGTQWREMTDSMQLARVDRLPLR